MEFKIILKKLTNRLSASEELEFEEWLNASPDHQNYFEQVKNNFYKEKEATDSAAAWKKIQSKIKEEKKRKRRFKLKAAVAISILILGISSLWYNSNHTVIEPESSNSQISVNADAHKAILSLGDGSEITLGEGQDYTNSHLHSNGRNLKYTSEASENATETEITYHTLTVPRGGIFHIELSDGTQVWLNSESQIQYPAVFQKGEPREVKLTYGEAFFEVSPSTLHQGSHFKVHSGVQTIEVLGTQFNLKNYEDTSEITTTLVEGSIELSAANSANKLILKPGKSSYFKASAGNWTEEEARIDYILAWKSGLFKFKDESLLNITQTLSRWYDKDILIKDDQLADMKFTGSFSKEQDLESILSILKSTQKINYSIENEKVLLYSTPPSI